MEHVKVAGNVTERVNIQRGSVGVRQPVWRLSTQIQFHTLNVYCGKSPFRTNFVFSQTLTQLGLNALVYVKTNLEPFDGVSYVHRRVF
jgi:hypothetical protein